MGAKEQGNASKKVYHHTVWQGGYKLAKQKRKKMEQDFIDKGIAPATINWPERLKNWYYARGGSLNPKTGECIYRHNIQKAAQRLQDAIQAVAQGTFQPDREKDELTYSFQNPKHQGRTRGKRSCSEEVWFKRLHRFIQKPGKKEQRGARALAKARGTTPLTR